MKCLNFINCFKSKISCLV